MFYVPRAMMHRFVQGHVSGAFLDVLISHSFEPQVCLLIAIAVCQCTFGPT